MPPPSPAISSSWREGRFFDLWMLAHVASGVAGGFSNVFFGLRTLNVYIVATVVMILWEVGEYIVGVRESWSNRVLDVLVGLVGVQVALWIAATLSPRGEVVAFVASLGIAIAINVKGWMAFRRRKSKS